MQFILFILLQQNSPFIADSVIFRETNLDVVKYALHFRSQLVYHHIAKSGVASPCFPSLDEFIIEILRYEDDTGKDLFNLACRAYELLRRLRRRATPNSETQFGDDGDVGHFLFMSLLLFASRSYSEPGDEQLANSDDVWNSFSLEERTEWLDIFVKGARYRPESLKDAYAWKSKMNTAIPVNLGNFYSILKGRLFIASQDRDLLSIQVFFRKELANAVRGSEYQAQPVNYDTRDPMLASQRFPEFTTPPSYSSFHATQRHDGTDSSSRSHTSQRQRNTRSSSSTLEGYLESQSTHGFPGSIHAAPQWTEQLTEGQSIDDCSQEFQESMARMDLSAEIGLAAIRSRLTETQNRLEQIRLSRYSGYPPPVLGEETWTTDPMGNGQDGNVE